MTKQTPRKPAPKTSTERKPNTQPNPIMSFEEILSDPAFDGQQHVKLATKESMLAQANPTPDDMISLSLPRNIVERILGNAMSRASQRAYNATWITGTETALPLVVAKTLDTHPRDGGAYTWGQSVVTYEEAKTLHTLAQALGYWVKPDEKGVYRPVKREG